jgi:hypothetical protein
MKCGCAARKKAVLTPEQRAAKSELARRLNSDPEIAARREEGRARYYDTPGVREACGARLANYNRNMPPEHREMRRQHGLRIAREVLARPDVLARSNSPEAKRKACAGRTATVLAWCPPELRDEYRHLCASLRLSAAEAREIIEEKIPGTAAHARREVANNILKQKLRHERQQMEAY